MGLDCGRDGEEGAGPPSGGPGVGSSWQPRLGVRVLSAGQVSAAAWEEPSPEILIQGRDRTGFSTGSTKGDRGRKKPRGQEGSGRLEGEVGGPDLGTPDPHYSSSLNHWGTSIGIDFASYLHMTDSLSRRTEGPSQVPQLSLCCYPVPRLSQV